jgi:hypothetical protein
MREFERLAVDIDPRFVHAVRKVANKNNVLQRCILESALLMFFRTFETTGKIEIANQNDFAVVDRILERHTVYPN